MSQSILVRNPYKSQVGNKAEDIHRMHSPLCPLCPLTLVWNAVLRSKGAHTRIKIPAHTAVTSTLRRLCARRHYVHPPASLHTPPLRPLPGVPAHTAVTSTLRRLCTRHRYVHSPASFLHTPPLRPPSGVSAHVAVTSTIRRHSCTRRRHVHPPASFLRRQES